MLEAKFIFIQEVINAAVAKVLKESPELKYLRVINGYKRFDPTRGMDYILDLLFSDSSKGNRLLGSRATTLRYRVEIHIEIIIGVSIFIALQNGSM